MTSGDILNLLADRHKGDIFVRECPTIHGMHRFDAWAMECSWTQSKVYGYEVKVSRSDFLRDNKWRDYLPYCNYLSFVCPKGIIKPEEIEPQVGIIEVASTGNRLFTRRKAQWREAPALDIIFKAVLMNRTMIVPSHYGRMMLHENPGAFWEEWLKEKKYTASLGQQVKGSLKKVIVEQVENVRLANEKLIAENQWLSDVKALCEKLNISKWDSAFTTEQKLKKFGDTVREEDRRNLRNAHSALSDILQSIGEEI